MNEAQDKYDESSYQGSITIDTFGIKVNLIKTLFVEKWQSLFVDIIFIENRFAHVDKSPVCFEEHNLSERGINRVTNENERSPHHDEKINENLAVSDNQELSKNLRLYGDKNMEIVKKDSQTQRKTYFQEAIYILEEIKNRFLPKDSVNSKVRTKLDISRLKKLSCLERNVDRYNIKFSSRILSLIFKPVKDFHSYAIVYCNYFILDWYSYAQFNKNQTAKS